MRRRALVLGVLALAVALVAPTASSARSDGPRFAPNHKISHSTSSNWAGYSAINGRYTTVSASWKQPTASCTSQTTYSSFWVGLDGDGSNTVEQTGTSADCSGGTPRYYAWYEMYPKYPTNLRNPVQPGDAMSASVTTAPQRGPESVAGTTRRPPPGKRTARLPRRRKRRLKRPRPPRARRRARPS